MAQFKYTLPSGAEFTLEAPAETTQAQADFTFYSQVAAGAFVGYRPGDTLTEPQIALANFGLSRLERGTAASEDETLLAVLSGQPISINPSGGQPAINPSADPGLETSLRQRGRGGADPAQEATRRPGTSSADSRAAIAAADDNTLLSAINSLPRVAPLPSLVETPITNPITQADFINVTTGLGPAAIGTLSATEVNSLLAQLTAVVGQSSTSLTQQDGLGKYGFNCEALERAGYVKPGTAERYFNGQSVGVQPNPNNFLDVLKSPSVWTGKDNIVSVDAILVDDNKQNKIQTSLMESSYKELVATGTIVPPSTGTAASVTTGQTWGTGQTLIAASALTLIATAAGFNGTNKLFGDFKNVLAGNTSGVASLADSVSGFGGSVSSLASGAYNTLGNIDATQAGTVATALATSVNADVGALVANASKFGPQASALWAKAGNANISALAGSGFDSAKNLAGNLYSQGSTLVAGQLGALQAQGAALQAQGKAALDQFGKASQSAVNFAKTGVSGLVSGVQPGAAFNNTTDRSTVDAAVTRVIGSDKITTPAFELPSLASIGTNKDIQQAQNFLKTAQQTGQALINQGQAAFAQASQAAAGLQNQGQGVLNTAQRFTGTRLG